VVLEREPGNRHDVNAILILNEGGDELGYVPREDAAEMAPLLDAGGWVEATVKKVIEARAGHTLPVIVSTMYRQGGERTSPVPSVFMRAVVQRVGEEAVARALVNREETPDAPATTLVEVAPRPTRVSSYQRSTPSLVRARAAKPPLSMVTIALVLMV